MSLWIAAITTFFLSAFFFYANAPCWQFERLWKKRKGERPPSDLMLSLGLTPIERRRISLNMISSLGALIIVACLFFGRSSAAMLAVACVSALAAGLAVGLGVHYLGSGAKRLNQFFFELDRQPETPKSKEDIRFNLKPLR